MSEIRIVWSLQAKTSLKKIFDYYNEISPQGAKRVKEDLLRCPKTIKYSKQYQVDEINPKYRRIVVRDFKVLYKETSSEILILDIISTRQDPSKLSEI
jgi:plasmid stabilization system protein ParE